MCTARLSLRTLLLSASLLAAAALASCSSAAEDPEGEPGPGVGEEEIGVAVPVGKMDDYFSTAGREYSLTGLDELHIEGEVPADPQELQALLHELAELRQNALHYFTHSYMTVKSSHDDNASYGGFRTTVRQQGGEFLDPEPLEDGNDPPRTYAYLFEAEVGGPTDLLSKLPLAADGRTFTLTLPRLTNSELRSGSFTRTYRSFDPETQPAENLTTIDLEIRAEANEADAYPEYQALFADDLLDVLIVVGGDYNEQRYDMQAARAIFDELVDTVGLEPPVEGFDELVTDSGPFVGTLDSNGRDIRIEVSLIHPDMQAEEGVGYEGLKQIFRDGMATADIVIYDGHAGYDDSYSGVVVHYNPRHAVPATDFRTLEMPDKYQIVVFNGCKTYTQYADNLYANPAKSEGNLDIITTVNFSWLSEMGRVTQAFLSGLTRRSGGKHKPLPYGDLLAEMNRGTSWNVIYGVHGVAGNPHMSPYGDVSTLCQACDAHADCPGTGNMCLRLTEGSSGRICGVACTADSGCPDTYACRPVRQGSTITSHQCLPASNVCAAN